MGSVNITAPASMVPNQSNGSLKDGYITSPNQQSPRSATGPASESVSEAREATTDFFRARNELAKAHQVADTPKTCQDQSEMAQGQVSLSAAPPDAVDGHASTQKLDLNTGKNLPAPFRPKIILKKGSRRSDTKDEPPAKRVLKLRRRNTGLDVSRSNACFSLVDERITPDSSPPGPENRQEFFEETTNEMTVSEAMTTEEMTPQKTAMDGATKETKTCTAIQNGGSNKMEKQNFLFTNATTKDQVSQSRKNEPKQSKQPTRRSTRVRIVSNRATDALLQASTSTVQSPASSQASDHNSRRRTTKKEKDMDKYTPSIDPSVEPKDDRYTPHELARMKYTSMSLSYIEQSLGKEFPIADEKPWRNKTQSEQATADSAKTEPKLDPATLQKERGWEKAGRRFNSRSKHRGFLRPAPKNIAQARRWLASHGDPLQAQCYAAEYSEKTKVAIKATDEGEPHRGAMRVDNLGNIMRSLIEYSDEKSEDDGGQDEEDAEHRLWIQSQPVNDTIEDIVSIVPTQPCIVTGPTDASQFAGNVVQETVPSERWHVNEVARRSHSAEEVGREKDKVELAALALLSLSISDRGACNALVQPTAGQAKKEEEKVEQAALALLNLRISGMESREIAVQPASSLHEPDRTIRAPALAQFEQTAFPECSVLDDGDLAASR